MSPMSRTNKILTAIVAVALIIVIAVLVITYLPSITKPSTQGSSITVSMGSVQKTFTYNDLLKLRNITSKGGYRTNAGVIKDNGTYTGVPVKEILVAFLNLTKSDFILKNFSLKVTASDMTETYNFSVIQGLVPIYNASNPANDTPIRYGGLMMTVLYEYNGQPLSGDSGPLRIGFLSPPGMMPWFTAGRLWLSDIQSIEIIPE